MTTTIPETTKQWTIVGRSGSDSLQYTEQPVPPLGDNQVLVKIQGASINARDLMIANGTYPFSLKDNVIPGSDGAGTDHSFLAVGRHVTRFSPGSHVLTILNQSHLYSSLTPHTQHSGLGASLDGTFRQFGIFDEHGLVAMPNGLSFTEAATLSCAGVAAWNALFGLAGKELKAGQWVLTQGTGGVSCFAAQFAKMVGARVIGTTSSDQKGELLTKLGADHVINYRETTNWGEKAKELTGGVGVDMVVDVTGPTSLQQSAKSVKMDGVVNVMGFIGGEGKDMPSLLDTWLSFYTARGVWVGSRQQMEDMCRAVEANVDKLRPVIDPKVFKLEQLKEAYEYLSSGKHRGKLCIDVQ